MARVIRSQPQLCGIVRGEVFDARAEAAQIVGDARAEADALRESARAEGHAAGYAAAIKGLFDLSKLRDDSWQHTEQQALRAVLLVAAELLGTTLDAEPARIGALLAPHLARVRRAQHLSLKVHPLDAVWLEQNSQALRERAGIGGRLELHADATIARGGCLLESNLGEVDARIETRLSELARALGLEPEVDAS